MEFPEFGKKITLQIEKEVKRLLKSWRSEAGRINAFANSLLGNLFCGCSLA